MLRIICECDPICSLLCLVSGYVKHVHRWGRGRVPLSLPQIGFREFTQAMVGIYPLSSPKIDPMYMFVLRHLEAFPNEHRWTVYLN
jgi:hypothetical protein